MKIISEYLDINYIKQVQKYLTDNTLLLDIETLGLSSSYYPIYLIGTIGYRNGELLLKQYLATSPMTEKLLLEKCFEETEDYHSIVTFNGNHFDLPYIRNRASKHGLISPYDNMKKFDLYYTAKSHKSLLGLSRCNQTSLEEFLGNERKDEYDGGRLIPVYKRYARSNDPEDEYLLLLHNYEDIKGMITLLSLRCYDRLHKTEIEITDMDITNPDEITVIAALSRDFPKPFRILKDSLHLSVEGNLLRGIIRPQKLDLKYFYPKPSDYVYLTEEKMVIPKILSSSIPKNKKEKATKENCFTTVSGYVLPLPDTIKVTTLKDISGEVKLLRKSYQDKENFIYLPIEQAQKNSSSNEELLKTLSLILKLFFVEK